MSIYGSRRDRVLDDDEQWERLMLKGIAPPRPAQSARGNKLPLPEDVARLRKANPVNTLLPLSRKWLNSVPEEARPVALATRYARVVNALAHQWNDHAACVKYFDELLIDHRGNRQGFPAAVQTDIRILHEYFLHSRQPLA